MSLKVISIGFVIYLCYFESDARVAENSSTDYGETCYFFSRWIEGLQANVKDCGRLWWCQPNGDETKIVPYNCTSLNNGTTPYFDVRTGECVENKDHCANQLENFTDRNTSRDYEPSGVNETCRGWGQDLTYYTEIFPNLHNSSLYWQCVPRYTVGDSVFRTVAISMSCPSNLIFSVENDCTCEYPGDADDTKAILEFNEHPANRFKCANLLNVTALETCHDEDSRYYVGQIPSNYSRRSYWECVRQGETLVSKPSPRSCLVGELFNVSTCSCSPQDDYFEDDSSYENTNRFKCAKLIEDCGNGEDPTCSDEDGHYYLGVIPHTEECSKYYICDWNPTPGVAPPIIPKPQQCQKGLIFNVNSPFCGCDYPENARCFANSDDKFKCASPANTMESP